VEGVGEIKLDLGKFFLLKIRWNNEVSFQEARLKLSREALSTAKKQAEEAGDMLKPVENIKNSKVRAEVYRIVAEKMGSRKILELALADRISETQLMEMGKAAPDIVAEAHRIMTSEMNKEFNSNLKKQGDSYIQELYEAPPAKKGGILRQSLLKVRAEKTIIEKYESGYAAARKRGLAEAREYLKKEVKWFKERFKTKAQRESGLFEVESKILSDLIHKYKAEVIDAKIESIQQASFILRGLTNEGSFEYTENGRTYEVKQGKEGLEVRVKTADGWNKIERSSKQMEVLRTKILKGTVKPTILKKAGYGASKSQAPPKMGFIIWSLSKIPLLRKLVAARKTAFHADQTEFFQVKQESLSKQIDSTKGKISKLQEKLVTELKKEGFDDLAKKLESGEMTKEEVVESLKKKQESLKDPAAKEAFKEILKRTLEVLEKEAKATASELHILTETLKSLEGAHEQAALELSYSKLKQAEHAKISNPTVNNTAAYNKAKLRYVRQLRSQTENLPVEQARLESVIKGLTDKISEAEKDIESLNKQHEGEIKKAEAKGKAAKEIEDLKLKQKEEHRDLTSTIGAHKLKLAETQYKVQELNLKKAQYRYEAATILGKGLEKATSGLETAQRNEMKSRESIAEIEKAAAEKSIKNEYENVRKSEKEAFISCQRPPLPNEPLLIIPSALILNPRNKPDAPVSAFPTKNATKPSPAV